MPTSRSGERLYAGTSGLGESSRAANARIKHAASASSLGKASAAGAVHKRPALTDKTNLQHSQPNGRLQDGKPQLSHARNTSSTTTDSNNTLKHKVPSVTQSQQAAPLARREPRSRQPSAASATATATHDSTALHGHLRHQRVPSATRYSSASSSTAVSNGNGTAELKHRMATIPTSSAPAVMEIDAHDDFEAITDDERNAEDDEGDVEAESAPVMSSAPAAVTQHVERVYELEDDEDMSDADSDWHGSSGSDSQGRKMSSKTETEEEDNDVDVDVDGFSSRTSQRSKVKQLDDAFDTEIVAVDEEEDEEEEEDDEDDEEGVPLDVNGQPLVNEFDPDCLLTLPFDLESLARQKVAAICDRYEDNVVRPQTERAAEERKEALAKGLVTPEVAAHDEELAQMGLDPEEVRDTSMAAEYAMEIFDYMAKCEAKTMANPSYMDFQGEIQW